MNRILLAYCRDNADLAHSLDHKLSRIGIPFEHVTDLPEAPTDAFSEYLRANQEPVLMLVTDNLLKNRHCMTGLLPAVQQLVREDRLLLVLGNGKDADGQPHPTHIDRMVHALQYMNHWQNIWLDSALPTSRPGRRKRKTWIGNWTRYAALPTRWVI